MAFIARIHADVACADRLGDGDDLIDVWLAGAADFQVYVQAEPGGFVTECLQLGRGHVAQAVGLAIEHVQAQPLQLVAIGEVQQFTWHDAALGQVGQQGVGVGEQAHAFQPLDKGVGQLRREQRGRASAVGVVA